MNNISRESERYADKMISYRMLYEMLVVARNTSQDERDQIIL